MRILVMSLVAMSLAGRAVAQPEGWVYTPIVTNHTAVGIGPAMNNRGEVAFWISGDVFLGDGRSPVPRVFRFQESPYSFLPSGRLSVDDHGHVFLVARVFGTDDHLLEARRDGPPVVRLRSTDLGLECFSRPSSGDVDTVTLSACLPGGGRRLFTHANGVITTIASSADQSQDLMFFSGNSSGDVAFWKSTGEIFVASKGTVALLNDDSGGGFPGINERGDTVFLNAHHVQAGMPGAVTTVARANDPTFGWDFRLFHSASINDLGDVAFHASFPDGQGIFLRRRGSPNIELIVATGPELDVLAGWTVQTLEFGNEGLNNLGQVAVALRTGVQAAIIRADPPGSTSQNPMPPRCGAVMPWCFPIVLPPPAAAPGRGRVAPRVFIDPAVAVGYRYMTRGDGVSNFASVLIPAPLPGGDADFTLRFGGTTVPLKAGDEFRFTDVVAEGVPTFEIVDINESEALDPDNPMLFVTGLTFISAFNGEVLMEPLTTSEPDTAPPAISVPGDISIVADALSGATVHYVVNVTDDVDPQPTLACTPAAGSFFTIGLTVVHCSATDASGNAASASFTVTVLFPFTGFFPPLESLPASNVAKSGSAIPVKFGLGGFRGLEVLAAGYPRVVDGQCVGAISGAIISETLTSNASGLQYDPEADQYVYIWKTEKQWAGSCLRFVLKLSDGSTHEANVAFR